jgi:hypothetical protein
MTDLASPVRANHNRNVVCVYSRGPRITHYLGLSGTELGAHQLHNDEFDREYFKELAYTAGEFARRYTRDAAALKMIPLTTAAARVLTGILRGQPTEAATHSSTNLLEKQMTEAVAFRKPDGPVALVHAFLDKKLDAIRAGKVSRKEIIEQLVAKDFSAGTVTTQCGVWAKANGIQFSRPTEAAVAKKVAAKAARSGAAAKKTSQRPPAKDPVTRPPKPPKE